MPRAHRCSRRAAVWREARTYFVGPHATQRRRWRKACRTWPAEKLELSDKAWESFWCSYAFGKVHKICGGRGAFAVAAGNWPIRGDANVTSVRGFGLENRSFQRLGLVGQVSFARLQGTLMTSA